MSLDKLGRYDIIRVLGKGAMGLVYEARDPNLNRRVAIKTIKVENLSEEAAAEYEVRFRTEAHSAARLQHPNIVSVYDSDRHGGMAFLVMEFIQGEDLKHHLDAGKRYSLAQTLGMVRDLLSALEYAHRQNIVHRDVKPANLLIEADGRVKLTDFGVARIQDSDEATRSQGSIVGTLKYMSPEQVQGLMIDARADLFAAGVVLYQLLTGQRPFDGDTDFAIIQQIVGHTPAAPSTFNALMPPAIDAVVARAMAKNREERFATAQAFSQALLEASGQVLDPTIVPPASAPDRRGWTATDIDLSRTDGSTVRLARPGADTDSTVRQEIELVYWKDIKDSADPEDLDGFLDKFPSGIYADLARRRLKKLHGPLQTDGYATDAGSTTPVAWTEEVSQWTRHQGLPAQALSASEATQPPALTAQAAPAASTPALPGAHAPEATRPGAVMSALDNTAPVAVPVAVPAAPEAELVQAADTPQASAFAAPTASGAPPVRRSKVPVFALAGVAVLVLAGLLVQRLSGDRAPVTALRATAVPATPNSVPVRPAAETAEAAVVAPAAARPARVSGPKQACENRGFLGYQICMNEQCAQPAFSKHPVCVERRAMEQRRRESQELQN